MIDALLGAAIGVVERGLVPDPLVRVGIRRLLAQRLATERGAGAEARRRSHEAFAREEYEP